MIDKAVFKEVIIRIKPELETVIDKVMEDQKRYDWPLIEAYSHLCDRCARCCKQEECEHLSDDLCAIYSQRPNVCRDYPQYYLFNGEYGLNFDYHCNYALGIVIHECFKELGQEGG